MYYDGFSFGVSTPQFLFFSKVRLLDETLKKKNENSYLLVNRKTGTPKLLIQVSSQSTGHTHSHPLRCNVGSIAASSTTPCKNQYKSQTQLRNTTIFITRYLAGLVCFWRKKRILQPRSQSLSLHCENEVQDISLAAKNALPSEPGTNTFIVKLFTCESSVAKWS